ncbi:hypothetical protein BGZ80_003338 [Entomortierella chlamydospora]|uniref:Uncharacterized protein n=1 Tax=Entomortierella chlamydospora TaxID=101097 RepID=A0A9P6T2W6_9FUNG|nr:hypothetical protein BGZ80_003338 [Entomortierella chlamydospora]
MSVPIMDPFYRDLQALQSDHSSLLSKLKQMQQMLQGSYQELTMAQQRSKRAETDSRRLRAQMDIILKKHVDHHPERESLVQQLSELQSRLDLELGSRKALEREYSALHQEFLRHKLNNATTPTTGLSTPTVTATSPSSPSISVRSLPFSSFLRGGRSAYQKSNRNSSESEQSPSVKNLRFTENNEEVLSPQEQQQVPPTPASSHHHQQQKQEEDDGDGEKTKSSYEQDQETISTQLQFEAQKRKQFSVSQSEIELLRSTIHEQYLCLNARESLVQTFAATVNSQAVDIEILTNQSCRDQAALAKVEQELALLFEASLMMLERWFGNVQQTKEKLERCMDPIRQTILQFGCSNATQEWEKFEVGVRGLVDGLARSLMKQQAAQDSELETGVVNTNYYNTKAYHRERPLGGHTSSSYSNTSMKATFGNDNNNNNSNALYNSNYSNGEDGEMAIETTPLVFDNTRSQEVFVWRKFTADTFLENCVKSVENLAQERRKLQIRLAELTQLLADQEERRGRCLGSGGDNNEKTKESSENLQQEKSEKNEPEKADNEDRSVGAEEHQTTTTATTATTATDSAKRADQLEAILKRVLEWGDRCHSPSNPKNASKTVATLGDLEDEMLPLGISNGVLLGDSLKQQPLPQSQALNAMRAEVDTTANDSISHHQNLETLLQWVRQQMASSDGVPFKSSAATQVEPETTVAAMLTDAKENSLSSSLNSLNSGSSIDNNGGAARPKIRPEAITTSLSIGYSSATPSPNSSCYTAPPSASSCSSTSSYFPNRVNIGGLAMPKLSPGLGGLGPDGKASILDMDAFCSDLAFRSFPKQHQWSKSRGGASKGVTTLLQTWSPISTTTTGTAATAAAAVPPLQPTLVPST